MNMKTGSAQTENPGVLFDSLFEQHHRALFSYLFGRCGHRDTAQDLLQETFIRVWMHIDEAKSIPSERIRNWLVTIAKSAFLDSLRRAATRAHINCPAPVREPIDIGLTPDRIATGRADLASLDAAIRTLPEDQRTVLVLSVMEGLTSVEIGSMLGIPAGTVRFQLSQARTRLAYKVGLS
jgi:RNA polymerase sigma-70 factor (ECF subfamily)